MLYSRLTKSVALHIPAMMLYSNTYRLRAKNTFASPQG